jgi:hypothetical protein
MLGIVAGQFVDDILVIVMDAKTEAPVMHSFGVTEAMLPQPGIVPFRHSCELDPADTLTI